MGSCKKMDEIMDAIVPILLAAVPIALITFIINRGNAECCKSAKERWKRESICRQVLLIL